MSSLAVRTRLDAAVVNEHVVHFEVGFLARLVVVEANEGIAQAVACGVGG